MLFELGDGREAKVEVLCLGGGAEELLNLEAIMNLEELVSVKELAKLHNRLWL